MLSISPRLSMQSRFVCWNSHHPHLALHRPDKNDPIFIGSVWCILISRPRLIHSLSMLLVVSVRVLMDFIESAWQVAASVKPNHLKQNFKLARLTQTRLFLGCLKIEKLAYVMKNGLAWNLPLAWYASIVVVFSYHPNAQAPNNPSRGEANGRCDISGRYFEFTDFWRQVKCMLFCQRFGGCDDCVLFPDVPRIPQVLAIAC